MLVIVFKRPIDRRFYVNLGSHKKGIFLFIYFVIILFTVNKYTITCAKKVSNTYILYTV